MKKNLVSDHECLMICWAARFCMNKDLPPRWMLALENSFRVRGSNHLSVPQLSSIWLWDYIQLFSPSLITLIFSNPKESHLLVGINELTLLNRTRERHKRMESWNIPYNENLSNIWNVLVYRKYSSSYSERIFNLWEKFCQCHRKDQYETLPK